MTLPRCLALVITSACALAGCAGKVEPRDTSPGAPADAGASSSFTATGGRAQSSASGATTASST